MHLITPQCLSRLQSLSLAHLTPRATPQPIADVSMHPGEVAGRLRAITVYTVVNKKNEFVLVSGEVGTIIPPDAILLIPYPGRAMLSSCSDGFLRVLTNQDAN